MLKTKIFLPLVVLLLLVGLTACGVGNSSSSLTAENQNILENKDLSTNSTPPPAAQKSPVLVELFTSEG